MDAKNGKIWLGAAYYPEAWTDDIIMDDIAKMKESFFSTLRTMNHSRIAYPRPKEVDATEKLAEKRQSAEAADKKDE